MMSWRHQPMAVRLLAGTAGVMTAAAAFAAPAEASPIDDAFIGALSNAGVNYGDPLNAEALGQSVCPMVSQPGGSVTKVASSVVARGSGMNQGMAEMFTTIAIQMYCPQVMADLASGQVPGVLQQLPGMASMPGLNGIPGIPGLPGR